MDLFSWLKIKNLIKIPSLREWFKGWFSDNSRRVLVVNKIGKIGINYGSTTYEEDPFTTGLYSLGLLKDQVTKCGEFFNNFYKQVENKQKKQITRNALTMLQGAIFAVGTRNQKNPEWKEHCASSLREIFHEWTGLAQFNSNLVMVFKGKSSGLTQEEAAGLRSFWLLYEYFSGVDHHGVSQVLHSLRDLHNDSTLKPEDCYTEKIFIEEVKDFFSKLFWIIEISKKEMQ